MLSSAFNPRPVVDDEGNVVEGLIEIDSMKVNKVSMSLLTAYGTVYCPFVTVTIVALLVYQYSADSK